VQQLFKAGGKGNLEIGQALLASTAGNPSVKGFERGVSMKSVFHTGRPAQGVALQI
jgi:hypothetical protein